MLLKDEIAVVTGGGSGIGRAIAASFVKEGAKVAVADIDLDAATRTAKELGPAALAVSVDVTDRASAERMLEEVDARLGAVSVLVNNAGVSYVTPFLECSQEIWDKTMDVNLKGAFNCAQAALARMVERKRGVVLNMSSQSGKRGNSHYAAYCASKFGIIGLTQALALEFAEAGIRVNAICPGVVFTPLWDEMIGDYAKKRQMNVDEVKPYLESKVPMGRLCREEDVADAAVYLASEKASYITGQAINVSGGAIMH